MTFGNPILGGDFLIRPAIKSPNFVAGVSGWSINRDGSAEFQNLVARLTAILGNPAAAHILLNGTLGKIQAFNNAGDLVVDIDANGIEALNPNGSFVNIFGASPASVINLQPADVGGFTFDPAALYSLAQAVAGREIAFLQLDSPAVDGNPLSTIILASADDLANPGYIELDPDGSSGVGQIRVTGVLLVSGDIQQAGASLPRGAIAPLTSALASTVVISAVAGTFTTILSDGADRAVKANRSYQVEYWNDGSIVSGGTGNAVGDRWNGKLQFSTNSGGAWTDLTSQKTIYRAAVAAAQRFEFPVFRGIYKPGADSTTTRFRLQVAKVIGAGTVTSQAEGDHFLEVTDKGAAI